MFLLIQGRNGACAGSRPVVAVANYVMNVISSFVNLYITEVVSQNNHQPTFSNLKLIPQYTCFLLLTARNMGWGYMNMWVYGYVGSMWVCGYEGMEGVMFPSCCGHDRSYRCASMACGWVDGWCGLVVTIDRIVVV